MAPGNSWSGSGKGVQKVYLTNDANDLVQIWTITFTALTYANKDVSTNIPSTNSGSIFAVGTLIKTVTIDEQGHAEVEYKDLEGREILKKVQVGNSISTDYSGQDVNWLCTYYVYDDLNQLRFVIPPKVVSILPSQSWSLDANSINELCFRYEYDYRKRLIAKKVPGAAWVYMIYDLRDRLVFTQDGNMRNNNQWLGSLFDILNRPVETGMLSYTGTPSALQTYASSIIGTISTSQVVTGTTPGTPSSFSNTIITINNAIPTGSTFIPLTITNHDNYSNSTKTFNTTNNSKLNQGTNFYADALPGSTSTLLQGLTTSEFTRVIENPSNLNLGVWLETATFYDDKGRVVQVQNTNYKGGLDNITTMYSFINKPVCTYQVHNNPLANISNFRIRTNLNYDNFGRLLTIVKNINDDNNPSLPQTTQRTIASYVYDALGQIKEKKIGQKTVSGSAPSATPLEDDGYVYNIRGWLKGINWQGYGSSATSPAVNYSNNKWFGLDISYDWGFTNNQLNGNVAGQTWVNGGDGVERAFGYGYDNASRLLFGDFNQNFGGTWGKSDPVDANFNINYSAKMGDGINYTSAYDPNGNILAMSQYAMVLNSSQLLDNLTYSYNSNSNKLNSISDAATEPTNMNLGDFTDRNTTGSDYGYDVNGNLITDKNKLINGSTGLDQITGGAILYNHLNLPFQVSLQNVNSSSKGTITYVYDAAGNKLEKRTNELATSYNNNIAVLTTTTYLENFIYQNNVIQFAGDEEGRIRVVTPNTYDNSQTYVYDYFVKDQLGNTRDVLTDELEQDVYPAATLETGGYTTENTYYNINTADVVVNPPSLTNPTNQSYVNNNGVANPDPGISTTATSAYMYHLNGATGDKTGLGITLKVMAGDNVTIFGRTFWHNNAGTIVNTGYNVAVNSLLTLLAGSTAVSTSQLGATASTLTTSAVTTGELTSYFTNNEPVPTAKPKAFINWILFDEQFRPVTTNGASGFIGVGASADIISPVVPQNITIPKGGFLYIYCSNESNIDVYFDNLQVITTKGPLLETNNYYPHGLMMNAISDKAVKINYSENKYKYNGQEMQHQEFTDGTGLEEYDFGSRYYDQQIARWQVLDSKSEAYPDMTPFNYTLNNPLKYVDPTGDDVYLIIWATEGGRIGHAGVAIDNYTTVVKKDKDGNIIYDKNGKAETEQVKTGTVTYYDFWPGTPVSLGNFADNVTGSYHSRITTLDDLKNTDVSGSENRPADGIIQLKTDVNGATDKLVGQGLAAFKQNNPFYNGINCNCSDFAKEGALYAAFPGTPLEKFREKIGTFQSTTPNQLYKATSTLPNAIVIKDPGTKVQKSFLDGLSLNRLKRLVANNAVNR